MSLKQGNQVSSWNPSKARYEFRTNPQLEGGSTVGFCMDHLQANMAMLPSALADDFEKFCELNRAACPILYRSNIGEVSAGPLAPDSDIRTDLTRYCVNKNGVITEEPGDLTAYSWHDMVSFYIGCSFSFEKKMLAAGIPLRHVSEKRCVAMFPTNIQCVPVGPFASPLVVSMRPIPKDVVEKALVISAGYEALHGAPIHIGDPSVIGIEDLYNSDHCEPSDIGDLIPVFWACGRSTSVAVRAAKLPVFFCHYPGSVFICDPTVDDYFKIHKPGHGDEQPKLVVLSEQPYLASVCSASAMKTIDNLGKIVLASPSSTDGTEDRVVNNFLKISLRLSHAPSVIIAFLCGKESFLTDNSTSQCLQAAVILIKALQALNKKITIVTQERSHLLQESITASAARRDVSTDGVRVIEWDEGCDIKERLFQDEINHRLDAVIGLEDKNSTEEPGLMESLFQQVESKSGIVSIKITTNKHKVFAEEICSVDSHIMTASSLETAGHGLTAALYVLNRCPIHSRYVRRGTGERRLCEVEQFVMNSVEDATRTQVLQIIGDYCW